MFTIPSGATGALLMAGLTGALSVPGTASAQAVEVDLDAPLHSTNAFPKARGHAEYESEDGGTEFDISISGVRGLAGGRVTVRVHGVFVGSMTVGPLGRAHLERHSRVPLMSPGDVVRVRTAAGRSVTYGTLHRDTD